MNQQANPQKVLIVDDDRHIAVVLAASLEKLGDNYEVETAYNGVQALTKIRQSNYALVVTDYQMPGMNGLDLLDQVRTISPDTRLILMTAYGSKEVEARALCRQSDQYIIKPFRVDDLREVAREALQTG